MLIQVTGKRIDNPTPWVITYTYDGVAANELASALADQPHMEWVRVEQAAKPQLTSEWV